MKQIEVSVPCLGYNLQACVTVLDEGLNVLLVGGCRRHVGAVSAADADGEVQTIQLPGHKDQVISTLWAGELAKRFHVPVSVACGIHYDSATKEQIDVILQTAQNMLASVFTRIEL